ncbi:MAG: hypothetical protein JO250_20095 [Armatimonadetes bacterium]|nr:hypothetical protein [Armatimonadota bacterium]
MGWDAQAVRSKSDLNDIDWPKYDFNFLEAFRVANEELERRTCFSGLVAQGSLGGPAQEFLARASPIPCYDSSNVDGELYWPPETVQQVQASANWEFAVEDIWDFCDYWAARVFLRVCAEQRLAIWFNW